ncbi:MAG: hypothetical protein SNG14_03210 [Rikenellaceae bacterium]
MSTLDNILQGGAEQSEVAAPVQSQETPAQPQQTNVSGYADLYKSLNPDPTPTQEQLDKEKKKQKRDKIIAAIGDGISAFSNLYFTTQGAPSMYDGKSSQSAQVKSRYDKLVKDRKDNATTYYNGLVKAQQMDDTAQQAERSWKRQLEIDERGREATKYQRERDRIEDERKTEATDYQRTRDEIGDKQKADAAAQARTQWQSTFNQNERKISQTAANNSKVKKVGFSDGNGNNIEVDDYVWSGSMQQVYEAILNDAEFTNPYRPNLMQDWSASQKEDFVKQNWHKSKNATALMSNLSKFEPSSSSASTEDTTTPDEEIIDYYPSDEDRQRAQQQTIPTFFSDYNPNK